MCFEMSLRRVEIWLKGTVYGGERDRDLLTTATAHWRVKPCQPANHDVIGGLVIMGARTTYGESVQLR